MDPNVVLAASIQDMGLHACNRPPNVREEEMVAHIKSLLTVFMDIEEKFGFGAGMGDQWDEGVDLGEQNELAAKTLRSSQQSGISSFSSSFAGATGRTTKIQAGSPWGTTVI